MKDKFTNVLIHEVTGIAGPHAVIARTYLRVFSSALCERSRWGALRAAHHIRALGPAHPPATADIACARAFSMAAGCRLTGRPIYVAWWTCQTP